LVHVIPSVGLGGQGTSPAPATYNERGMRGLRSARIAVIPLFLAVPIAFSALPLRAESVASLPQPTDYVSDFAHVLSPEAVAQIDSICQQLDHSAAKAQVAVVTVHDLNGDSADDYANELEDHWKMGNKGQNRYAMVLLAVADHKYRIEVGYGLEGILPDGKVGDIGRAMVPDLRAGDYDGAVTLAVGEVAQVIAADAKISLDQDLPAPAPQPVQHDSGAGKLILLIIFLLFFGGGSLLRMLFGWGLFFGGWGRGGWRGGPGLGGPWIGGGGSGGFSGGGGGGFSGFGGMGGGFGGGGAGGSW
jgi:uncharacterized protein